ncbi:MAG: hypothetical protein D6801_09405, partial [Alphaproteobacteria bacterium]
MLQAKFALSGSNWTIKSLEVGSKNDNNVTTLIDKTAGGGRTIGVLDVGHASNITLKSTTISGIIGGTGNHTLVLGSGSHDLIKLAGDTSLTGGSGFIDAIRIGGSAQIEIN